MTNKLYEFNDFQKQLFDIKLHYISESTYGEDWHSQLHSHPFIELFYVTQGAGTFFTEGKTYKIKEDDMVIINPNVMHTESSDRNAPLQYIAMAVEGLSIFTNSDPLVNILNYAEYKHEVLFYIKTILQEATTKTEYYETVSKNLLTVLLINIKRRTNIHLEIANTKTSNHICQYVQAYIDTHYKKDIDLEKLAEYAHINKYYLAHIFKKHVGISPINYLNEKRLYEATLLLKNTDYTIADISNIIGMSSQSYFSQTFKKKFNTTPILFRKNMKSTV